MSPFAEPAAAAGSADIVSASRDLAILVDVSKSMDGIFPQVQAALHQAIADARVDDTVMLIAFSKDVNVVGQVQIAGPVDRGELQDRAAALIPTGRYTNVTGAVARGQKLLRDAYHADHTGRVRIMVLLTDGRHNPADAEGSPSFQNILNQYGDVRPGREWFIHYIRVRDVEDEETLAFVKETGGQVSVLRPDNLEELATKINEILLPVPIRISDVHGDARLSPPEGMAVAAQQTAGLEVGAALETGAYSYVALEIGRLGAVGVEANTRVEVRQSTYNPVTEQYVVELHVPRGQVLSSIDSSEGKVTFDVVSAAGRARAVGTAFATETDPESSEFTVAVFEGQVAVDAAAGGASANVPPGQMTSVASTGTISPVRPLSPRFAHAWTVWQQALVGRESLRALASRLLGIGWSELGVDMGALVPGAALEQFVDAPVGPLGGGEMQARIVDSTLPGEIAFSAAIAPSRAGSAADTVRLHLLAQVPAGWAGPSSGMDYGARVVLTGPGITPTANLAVPVTFSYEAPKGAIVQEGAPSWPALGGFALFAAALLGAVGYGWHYYENHQPPLGRLLIVHNPHPDRWRHPVIDFDSLRRSRGRSVGVIDGVDARLADLPEKAIHERNVMFRVRRSLKTGRGVVLEVKDSAGVQVNNQPAKQGITLLEDRMRVHVGKFEFEFEDSRHYQRVTVALRDSRTVRGRVRSWNLGGQHFRMGLDTKDVRLEKSARVAIAFKQIEDITVHLDPRHPGVSSTWPPSLGKGHRAQVIMESGREHKGWLRKDYNTGADRFYFFPQRGREIDFMIIERTSVAKVDVEA